MEAAAPRARCAAGARARAARPGAPALAGTRGLAVARRASPNASPPGAPAKAAGGPFAPGSLPRKAGSVLLLLALARLGQYLPIAGLDKAAIAASLASGAGAGGALSGMQAALTGGGVARFGLFSLGIIPAINASIAMQLATVINPGLKKLLREEGEAGRRKYQQYQRLVTLAFALAQGLGTVGSLRPFATDPSFEWVVITEVTLVAGAIVTMYISEAIDEYKLGNGSSLLIFMNILSGLPTSLSASIQGASSSSVAVGAAAVSVLVLTSGIVFVQEAERKLPLNYAQKYTATTMSLRRESYLPLKINSSGVMPIILSSSALTFPEVLSQFSNAEWIRGVAAAFGPSSALHLPLELLLIAYFNGFYTKLQLDPDDVSKNLQRSGASLVGVRPGAATATELEEVRGGARTPRASARSGRARVPPQKALTFRVALPTTPRSTGSRHGCAPAQTLDKLNVLGGIFLALLAVTPTAIEAATGVPIFRGFTGTSLLILVGVATDTARKVRSELVMKKYEDVDSLYDNMKL